jgi:hypothetical protein
VLARAVKEDEPQKQLLTGLHVFVVASYGPQQKVSVAIEQAVVEFAQAERQRLAQGMSPKPITVCQDETFHPQACLVAIEPVSNYSLLEKYAESQTAAEWTRSMAETSEGLTKIILSANPRRQVSLLLAPAKRPTAAADPQLNAYLCSGCG